MSDPKTDDKCKQCGACRTCDICACCGKCRECGKVAAAAPTVNPPTFIPMPYPVPQPYPHAPSPGIPWWDPYAPMPTTRPIWMVEPWPTIMCDTFTLTDGGAVQ